MKHNGSEIKKVAVIGATGSVGSSVLDVCRHHRDCLEVVALAAERNVEKLAALSAEFGASKVYLASREAALELKSRLKSELESDGSVTAFSGPS